MVACTKAVVEWCVDRFGVDILILSFCQSTYLWWWWRFCLVVVVGAGGGSVGVLMVVDVGG